MYVPTLNVCYFHLILVNTGMYEESLVELLTMKFHENLVVLELLYVGRQADRETGLLRTDSGTSETVVCPPPSQQGCTG
jgi:hypothetical protein